MMNLHNKKGFTLVELLLTISLLAAVVLTLFAFYDFGRKTFMQQSSEIVSETEIREAMELILTECRKAKVYSVADDTLHVGNDIISFKTEDDKLIMVKRNSSYVQPVEAVLCYDISSLIFDVKTDRVDIGIYSKVKNSKNERVYLESVYYIRKDYD